MSLLLPITIARAHHVKYGTSTALQIPTTDSNRDVLVQANAEPARSGFGFWGQHTGPLILSIANLHCLNDCICPSPGIRSANDFHVGQLPSASHPVLGLASQSPAPTQSLDPGLTPSKPPLPPHPIYPHYIPRRRFHYGTDTE